MKFITRLDYIKYRKEHPEVMVLAEEGVEYKIPTEEEKKYGYEKIEQVDKKHDKMLKVIFSQKKEVAQFLNQFLKLEEKIQEENLLQCPTEFITRQYKEKQVDILYRLKDKEIYFLIEHQSTVDNEMIERIGKYVIEIMRRAKNMNLLYPVVVPIVIYTGFQSWRAKTKFSQKQYFSKAYSKYQNTSLWYNLITVQDYTFEALLQKGTLFSSFMIMEKCKTKEELIIYMNKIIEKFQKEEEKEALTEIINNIIAPQIEEEVASKMLKKMKKKEEMPMSPLTKMLFDLELKGEERGEKRGEKRGKKEGRKLGMAEGIMKTVQQTAEKMLKKNMNLKDIEEITGLTQEEIKKLQECI